MLYLRSLTMLLAMSALVACGATGGRSAAKATAQKTAKSSPWTPPPATKPAPAAPPSAKPVGSPAPSGLHSSAVPCRSVDDCWFRGREPIARPKKLRGKRFKPCVDGELAPVCVKGFCSLAAYGC